MVLLFIFCYHPRVRSISSVVKQILSEDNYHVSNVVRSRGVLMNDVPATLSIKVRFFLRPPLGHNQGIWNTQAEYLLICPLSLSNQDWMTQWPDFQGIRFQFLRRRSWLCFLFSLPVFHLYPLFTFGIHLKQGWSAVYSFEALISMDTLFCTILLLSCEPIWLNPCIRGD